MFKKIKFLLLILGLSVLLLPELSTKATTTTHGSITINKIEQHSEAIHGDFIDQKTLSATTETHLLPAEYSYYDVIRFTLDSNKVKPGITVNHTYFAKSLNLFRYHSAENVSNYNAHFGTNAEFDPILQYYIPQEKSVTYQGVTYDISDVYMKLVPIGDSWQQALAKTIGAQLNYDYSWRYPLLPPMTVRKDELIYYYELPMDEVTDVEYRTIRNYPKDPKFTGMMTNYSFFDNWTVDYSYNIDASVTKPNDVTIPLGETATFDTLITSVASTSEETPWYGTFQIKKAGSDVWETVTPDFMNTELSENNQSYRFVPDASYHNAQVRYQYVFKDDTDTTIYSLPATLTLTNLPQPPVVPTDTPNTTVPEAPETPLNNTVSNTHYPPATDVTADYTGYLLASVASAFYIFKKSLTYRKTI